jgi:hypothetical protein
LGEIFELGLPFDRIRSSQDEVRVRLGRCIARECADQQINSLLWMNTPKEQNDSFSSKVRIFREKCLAHRVRVSGISSRAVTHHLFITAIKPK